MVKRGKLSREFFSFSSSPPPFSSSQNRLPIFGRETVLSFPGPFLSFVLVSNQPSTSHFQGAPVLINPPSGPTLITPPQRETFSRVLSRFVTSTGHPLQSSVRFHLPQACPPPLLPPARPPLPSRSRAPNFSVSAPLRSPLPHSSFSSAPPLLSIHHFLFIRGLMTRENSTARLKFDRSLISRSFFNYRSSFFFLSPSGKRKEIGGRKRSARSVRERKASKLREWCPVTFFFFFLFLSFLERRVVSRLCIFWTDCFNSK